MTLIEACMQDNYVDNQYKTILKLIVHLLLFMQKNRDNRIHIECQLRVWAIELYN